MNRSLWVGYLGLHVKRDQHIKKVLLILAHLIHNATNIRRFTQSDEGAAGEIGLNAFVGLDFTIIELQYSLVFFLALTTF